MAETVKKPAVKKPTKSKSAVITTESKVVEPATTSASGIDMYAVVAIQGKQYKVSPGMKIICNRMENEIGTQVNFDKVLLSFNGSSLKIGKPTTGDTVIAKVLEHNRDRKVIIFKKIRRHGYQRKHGHRQHQSVLEIISI